MSALKQLFSFLVLPAMIFSMAHLTAGCSMTYNGEKLFFRVGCSQCHTYQGKGGRMGPDLSAVSSLRSDSWIDSYIQDPKAINPSSRMPSFSHLSAAKRKAIIGFLQE